jgi:hypothetical protein
MFRMKGNPTSPAANHRLSAVAPRLQSDPPVGSPRVRSAKGRGLRRDDATFIAIAALLAILVVAQTGWVVARQAAAPETSVSRP